MKRVLLGWRVSTMENSRGCLWPSLAGSVLEQIIERETVSIDEDFAEEIKCNGQ